MQQFIQYNKHDILHFTDNYRVHAGDYPVLLLSIPYIFHYILVSMFFIFEENTVVARVNFNKRDTQNTGFNFIKYTPHQCSVGFK